MISPSAPEELALRLFGPFAATVGGQPLPRLRSRREQHLLCLLALRSPRPAERVWLAGTLWPGSTEEAALSNLRRSLHLVRAALGVEGTRLHCPTPATLALNTDGADVDVVAFDAALRQKTPDALETALSLYTAPLLEDCTEEWAVTERAARQEGLLTACETCGAECTAAGDRARAAPLLRRALALDPLRETTVRALMESLAASGDAAGAMDTFRRFRRRLRRELDAAPAPETRALLGQITDALSPVPAVSVRLPRPLTPLVGRRHEVRETVRALDTARLVTLTGTGGVGKTRLAIATAEDVSEECDVCFIALATLTDTAPLAAAVARTLDIAEVCDTTDALLSHLRERSLLLVLDNCEHIVDACAAFAAALLEGCPRLRVLATSRQPLGLPGEAVRPVPLLSLPSASDISRPAADYDAVQLFVARAQAARASFSPDPRTLPAVVRICRRLDGLPLAIELAAARVRSLSCEQIAQKLDDRFSLLASGNRGALPRHQTLRAAVDWSYDLLTESERLLLCRLAVFAGGWTSEAAEDVCGDGGVPVLDALSGLVDKSLVQMHETADGTPRYFLLETLREYGQGKSAKMGEADVLSVHHARWFLALAEQAEAHLEGSEQAVWLVRLETEHDNLRASLAWYEQSGESAESGLRLAGALRRFWEVRGYFSEGRQWLDRVLEKAKGQAGTLAGSSALGNVFNGAGNLAYKQGDYAAAQSLYQEGLAFFRRIGQPQGTAAAFHNLGIIAFCRGDLAGARILYQEGLAIRRRIKDERGIAGSLNNLGNIAHSAGDYETAQAFYEEGLTCYRNLGNQHGIAILLDNLGLINSARGDYETARALLEESLAIRRQMDNQHGVAAALNNLGCLAVRQHKYKAAHALFREGLTIFRDLGDRQSIASALEGLAAVAHEQNQQAWGVRLLGAVSQLRQTIGSPLPSAKQEEIDQQLFSAREGLGDTAFGEAWETGRAMTLDEAVTFALQEKPSVAPPPQEAQSAGRAR